MKEFDVFDGRLTVHVSDEDWEFFCNKRILNQNPSTEDIECEFVTGTGIIPSRKDLWSKADTLFAEYIEDLREFSKIDINAACRALLESGEVSIDASIFKKDDE